ncbi:MAG: LysR family transcriptional regulator [Bacteriovorax sp.]
MLNFNHFYYFYITAQIGGITKASSFLNISQPSLSIQLKNLEEMIGFKLFNRTGHTIILTDKGKVVYEYCEKMYSEVEGLENFLKNNDKMMEHLKIGVSEQIERPFLADVIGKFLSNISDKNIPKIKMETLSDNEMISLLHLGKLDLVISPVNFTNKGVDHIRLNIPVAFLGKDKNILKIGSSIKNIKSYFKTNDVKLVTSIESFILRTETDYYLSKNDCKSKIIFESGNLAATARALSEGIGVGFLPIIYVLKDIKASNLFSYMPSGGVWKHKIYVYYSSTYNQKDSIRNFIKTIEEVTNY